MSAVRIRLAKIWKLARARDAGFLDEIFLNSRLDIDVLVIDRDQYDRILAEWIESNQFRGLGDFLRNGLTVDEAKRNVSNCC